MFRILIMTLVMLLTSCASDPIAFSKDAEENFHKAEVYMENESYSRVIMFLEKFSAKFPYSQYATAAEFMRLKASYLDGQYILSETLGLRFIEAHPEHEKRVQADFYIAMSFYKQSSASDLDQKFSQRAHKAFLSLNQKFPSNPQTKEIKKYLHILTNRVAENELIIGKFYFEKELYIAAINRFTVIKNEYIDATAAAEGLYYLANSYLAVDQKAYADEIISLLKHNFPKSDWYKRTVSLI